MVLSLDIHYDTINRLHTAMQISQGPLAWLP